MPEALHTFAARYFNLGFYSATLAFDAGAVLMLGTFSRGVRTLVQRLLDLVLVLAADAALSLALFGATGQANGSMPVHLAVLIGYAAFQSDLLHVDRAARCATYAAAFVLIVGITGILTSAFVALQRLSWGIWLPNFLSAAAMLGVAVFLKRFSVSRFGFLPSTYLVLLLGIDALAGWAGTSFMRFMGNLQGVNADALASRLVNQLQQQISSVNLTVDLGFLALILLAYGQFYVLAREHEQRAERLVISRAEADSAEMIGVTRSVYESLREMRHEMRNRDAYMRSLIEAGEYDKLRAWFDTYQSDAQTLLRYVQSGNTVVDAAVNAKIALANDRGIELRCMLAVPEHLGVEEGQLYSLIANLLDNAIEGTEASGVLAEQRTIRLSIRPEGSYYVIAVSSPCKERCTRSGSYAELATTKEQAEGHGYGTKIVARIAEAHHGTARYSIKDGTFTTTVMIGEE